MSSVFSFGCRLSLPFEKPDSEILTKISREKKKKVFIFSNVSPSVCIRRESIRQNQTRDRHEWLNLVLGVLVPFFCRRHTHTHIRSSHATWFVFELRYILGNKQQHQLAYLMLESGAEIDWSITRKRINSVCVCVCGIGLFSSYVLLGWLFAESNCRF